MTNDKLEVVTRNKWVSLSKLAKLWPTSNKFNENQVYFIGPFREPYDTIYEQVIKKTVETYGLECFRDDDNPLTEQFFERIVEAIKTSRFVIADLSLMRPNVLFELGWVIALGTPCVLFTRDKRPSDMRLLDIPGYDFSMEGLTKMSLRISNALLSQGIIDCIQEIDINFTKILERINQLENLESQITVSWAVFGEDGRYEEAQELNLSKIELFSRKELELEPYESVFTEAEREDTSQDYVKKIGQFALLGMSKEEYEKRRIEFNKELEENKNEVEQYIIDSSIYEKGKIINVEVQNHASKAISDVSLELEFPIEILLFDEFEEPIRPVSEIPKLLNYMDNILALSPVLPPSSTTEKKGKGLNRIEDNIVRGTIYKISHRAYEIFPLSIRIGSFEEGLLEVKWTLSYEGLSEPLKDILQIRIV